MSTVVLMVIMDGDSNGLRQRIDGWMVMDDGDHECLRLLMVVMDGDDGRFMIMDEIRHMVTINAYDYT